MTSLFNEIQSEIIENPRWTWNYRKILKEKEEKIKTKKEMVQEMREKLPPEEFKKRYRRLYYDKEKEQKKYQEKKREWDLLTWELIDEIYSDVPDLINRDDYYTKKYRDDDTVCNVYNFARWSSRLMRINRKWTPKWTAPFRISKRHAIINCTSRLFDTQVEAYKYLKPHIDEIRNCKYALAKKQYIYAPLYYMDEPMRTIIENSPVPNHRAIYIADGMIRWKFMVSELYLGRDSFIFWDVLVTQTWNTFRIALENNLPWLTKDTVEEIHSLRMDWRKNKWEKAPPIYIVNDAYLIQIPINEREILYYIVPT